MAAGKVIGEGLSDGLMLEGGLVGLGNDRKSPALESTQRQMWETMKCSWGVSERLNLFVDRTPT
jgi:hypothetical protein